MYLQLCPRCEHNFWGLVELVPTEKRARISCMYCGRRRYKMPTNRARCGGPSRGVILSSNMPALQRSNQITVRNCWSKHFATKICDRMNAFHLWKECVPFCSRVGMELLIAEWYASLLRIYNEIVMRWGIFQEAPFFLWNGILNTVLLQCCINTCCIVQLYMLSSVKSLFWIAFFSYILTMIIQRYL